MCHIYCLQISSLQIKLVVMGRRSFLQGIWNKLSFSSENDTEDDNFDSGYGNGNADEVFGSPKVSILFLHLFPF